MYPDKEELLAAAWDWITQPEGGDSDRLHYYFAEEAAEAEEEEMIPEAPAQEPWQALGLEQNMSPGGQEAHSCPVGHIPGEYLKYPPGLDPPDGGVVSEDKGYGDFKQGPSHFGLRRPLGDSGMTALQGGSTTPAAELLKEMPPPQAAAKMRQLPLVPASGEAETLALTAKWSPQTWSVLCLPSPRL